MTDNSTTRNRKKKGLNWKKIITSFIVVIIVVCLFGGSFFAWSVYKETEDFSAQRLLSGEASKIYDTNGELMYTYGSDINGKRENITYEDLPQVLIDAVVAAEDSRFFEHDGFDLPRIAKTLITNLAHFSIRGGGSTITQQVIKKSYFPEEQKTYTRKISEIFLAIQATKEVSKEEIITLYLNKIYFGRSTSSIGVAAASKYYFNKEVSQLTLPEAALLAGTLNSPSAYDPYYNLDLATKRRNIILNLMVDHGYITQEECDLAKQVKIENMLSQSNTTSDNALAAYVDLVTAEVKEKTGLDPAETQMNIYTYCNQNAQKEAAKLANGETYKYTDEDMQMSGSIQSTQDGRIVAVIGGRNYKLGDKNKATLKRQPGSSMKPILDYGLAYKYLDWSTVHTVVDEPTTFPNNYNPKNWDNSFHGSMPIKEALVKSWNIPAVSTFQEVLEEASKEDVVGDMESLGIDMSTEDLQLSYAIGGWANGVTPIELAGAYATVANNGIYIESHTVNYVEVPSKNKTYNIDKDIQAKAKQSIGDDVSFMIRETMLSYSSSGYGNYAYLSGIDKVGAKTGTSNTNNGASKDLWMTAYTPDYTCSVWMGFEEKALAAGKNTSKYKAYPGKVVGELLKYLQDNTSDKKTYPDKPDNVEEIKILAGVYPYVSPNANTPSDKIYTGWAKKGTGPNESAVEYDINKLSSFSASLSSNGKIEVSFSEYEPSSATTDENATEATKMYGVIEYVVEISDPNSGEVLYTTTLNQHEGTIDYTPNGKVNVTGYYRFHKAPGKVSNKITKSVGSNKPENKINYSITSNGTTVTNGGTTASSTVIIKVNAQNSSNNISIQLYTLDGSEVNDTHTFTGSGSKEFELISGVQYRVKISESDGTKTISDTVTFTVGGNSNPSTE